MKVMKEAIVTIAFFKKSFMRDTGFAAPHANKPMIAFVTLWRSSIAEALQQSFGGYKSGEK